MSEEPSGRSGGGWRRVLLCLPLVLLGLVGGFVLTHAILPRPDPPHVGKLQHIRERLADLKQGLVDYKARTGTYPTNDQGLSVLPFDVRYPAHCEAVVYGSVQKVVSCGTSTRQVHWPPPLVRRDGRPNVPRSAEELVEGGLTPYTDRRELHPVDLEVAVSQAGMHYLVSPAGVSSGWTVPLGYENRRGLPESTFANSPATKDRSRRYSVRVDEGVYLYSTEGELYAHVPPSGDEGGRKAYAAGLGRGAAPAHGTCPRDGNPAGARALEDVV